MLAVTSARARGCGAQLLDQWFLPPGLFTPAAFLWRSDDGAVKIEALMVWLKNFFNAAKVWRAKDDGFAARAVNVFGRQEVLDRGDNELTWLSLKGKQL